MNATATATETPTPTHRGTTHRGETDTRRVSHAAAGRGIDETTYTVRRQWPELRRHLRDQVSEGILFRGLRGAEMLRRDQFYNSAWRPALRAAGLAEDSFKFHACRHWCASTLLAEGAPITAVAGHLGDTVETVSRVYAHWLRDDRDVPAAVLDRVLAPGDALRARDEASDAGS
jgi:integrase